jgi:hypothetical protein
MPDFVAVAPPNYSELVMVINPKVPAKDLKGQARRTQLRPPDLRRV